MMKLQMNPDEFAAKMREIATGVDPEGSHADV
jgi:hypothetical protein